MDNKVKIGTCWLDGCSGCHMSLLDIDEGIVAVLKKADIVFGPLVDAQDFPEGTDVKVRRDGNKLHAPGVGDDSAGMATMLALIDAMAAGRVRTKVPPRTSRTAVSGETGRSVPGSSAVFCGPRSQEPNRSRARPRAASASRSPAIARTAFPGR